METIVQSASAGITEEDIEAVKTEVKAELQGTAPETLNTIEEIAAALNNDEDVVSGIMTAIGLKANTSDVTTALAAKADSSAVTTALGLKADASALATEITNRTSADGTLQTAIDAAVVSIASKAPTVSPVFTGNPQAPTPSPGDNDTSIATTGFVATALASATPVDHSAYQLGFIR